MISQVVRASFPRKFKVAASERPTMTLTRASIAILFTFQRNSIMATINATKHPTPSTKNTPPTFAVHRGKRKEHENLWSWKINMARMANRKANLIWITTNAKLSSVVSTTGSGFVLTFTWKEKDEETILIINGVQWKRESKIDSTTAASELQSKRETK